MKQIVAACLLMLLASVSVAASEELKPKFGDIDGVYYTEIADETEACRQAIKNKIALCRQNTSFESNTKDRKYPGCLPIFEQQAEICVAHFRRQESSCELQGSVRITDFTGFACTVTAVVVEEGGEPEQAPGIVPADRLMQARTRTNVRSGAGTDHAKVGLLEAGEEVQVTGESGEWLRIERPRGGEAFVFGSLLTGVNPQEPEAERPDNTAERERLEAELAAADRDYEAAESRYSKAQQARHDAGRTIASTATRMFKYDFGGFPFDSFLPTYPQLLNLCIANLGLDDDECRNHVAEFHGIVRNALEPVANELSNAAANFDEARNRYRELQRQVNSLQ